MDIEDIDHVRMDESILKTILNNHEPRVMYDDDKSEIHVAMTGHTYLP